MATKRKAAPIRKTDLHERLMTIARKLAVKHVQTDEGEKVFHLGNFRDELSVAVEEVVNGRGSVCGGYGLSDYDIAEYLWCCLALENGDSPAKVYTFQGMPVIS